MAKKLLMLAATCMICGCGGCVAAIGNTVSFPDQIAARKPVAIDGRIYVVDVRTGKVMALEPGAVENAQSFEMIRETHTESVESEK